MKQTDFVGEDHETPIGLSAQGTPHALRGVTDRIEAQELRFADAVRIAKVLEACL